MERVGSLRLNADADTILVDTGDVDQPGGGKALGFWRGFHHFSAALAISNAVFDATGVKLRVIPFTPEEVKAAFASRTKGGIPSLTSCLPILRVRNQANNRSDLDFFWHIFCTSFSVIPKISLALLVFLAGCSYLNRPTRAEIDELKTKISQQNVDPVVREMYEAREFRPLWVARGRTIERLQQFFQFVDDRSDGVSTDVEKLREPRPSDPIQFDIEVTKALAKHVSAIARKDANIRQAIQDAIESDTISQLSESVAPKHIEYIRLKMALNTAQREIADTIRVNMKRWRKMPDDLGYRHIRVNIPSFELEVHEGNAIPLKMRVVVGTDENKTPLFSSEMKYVVFSPYWNIPESIMTNETLPRILQDPEYATRQNLEVVKILGKSVEVIDPEEIDWENVGESDIQLRQKPGNGNSLGLVKFIFPNKYNVYLHDTPADNLFDRLTRAFSHGCVRVQRPQELAEHILKDQPEWTAKRIRRAMQSGAEKHVALKEPIPVHLLYFTAWVDDSDTLHIEKDIYGYDKSGRQ